MTTRRANLILRNTIINTYNINKLDLNYLFQNKTNNLNGTNQSRLFKNVNKLFKLNNLINNNNNNNNKREINIYK